jgi:hypothetical protein
MTVNSRIVSAILGWTILAAIQLAAAEEWDDLKGSFVYDGQPPAPNMSRSSVVRRAETTPLRRTNGTAVGRVERDREGHVTALLLNEMQLSSKEIQEIAALPQIRRLVLYRTNLADKGLRQLRRCTRLEHLNLTGTSVSDAGINELLELKRLDSLCLGNVDITADAITRLKEGYESRGQVVKIGYSRRTK